MTEGKLATVRSDADWLPSLCAGHTSGITYSCAAVNFRYSIGTQYRLALVKGLSIWTTNSRALLIFFCWWGMVGMFFLENPTCWVKQCLKNLNCYPPVNWHRQIRHWVYGRWLTYWKCWCSFLISSYSRAMDIDWWFRINRQWLMII